jgi:glycosyltransferase involved in cell wall biosynthesis
MAKLTIAIPFYSGRAYLRRALDSVVRQTCPDWELLVCDDASAEPDIQELVTGYGDARMHYCRNPVNLGMAGNWNRCLDLARTDLLTLLHADDELLENYCALMLDAAVRFAGAAAFFCGARIIDAEGQRRFSFPDFVKGFLVPPSRQVRLLVGERSLQALLRGNFIMCPTLCYRRRVLGERRFGTDWKFVQDLELTARLLLDGEQLVGLREVAYAYRRHGANATVQYTESLARFREEAELYDALRARAWQKGWAAAAAVAQRKLIIKLNLAYCTLRDLLRLRPRQALQKGTLLSGML